jgi:hypothetical protein
LLGYNGSDVDVQGELDNGYVAEGMKKSFRERSEFIRECDVEMLRKGRAINDVIVKLLDDLVSIFLHFATDMHSIAADIN